VAERKKNRAAQELVALRNARLTPEQRSEIARKAGSAPKKKRAKRDEQ